MRLSPRKCAILLKLAALVLISVVCLRSWLAPRAGSGEEAFGESFLALSLHGQGGELVDDRDTAGRGGWKFAAQRTAVSHPDSYRPKKDISELEAGAGGGGAASGGPVLDCTMGRCFNASRCRDQFRVYVYPDSDELKASPLHRKILSVLRSSRYHTSDPRLACVFVPSWDTLDRDKLSDAYVHNLPASDTLPFWSGGKNHLFFNLYSGSWPLYEESLDFDTGQAIVAKASFDLESFRPGFDISLPLIHNSHPERGSFPSALVSQGNILPPRRKYLVAFKGKRYLYGLGVEPRRSLYHLHNGEDVVMATTCRHNKNWEKFQDERCHDDNTLYDRSVQLMIIMFRFLKI